MTLGIGLYGPCLILVSLLGIGPIAAFPIMMGSCAFLYVEEAQVAEALKIRFRGARARLAQALGP